MSVIRFIALSTDQVNAYRRGSDANNQLPERHISDGAGNPCRHCLTDIATGVPFLILAHRPFDSDQAYAERGPIFLHAGSCPRYIATTQVPPMFLKRRQFLMRGYNADHRIVYGSGGVVLADQLEAEAVKRFADPNIEYIHLRSGTYNCYQCRIERDVPQSDR